MNYEIICDQPDDGAWVMLRVGGVYNDKTDHVIAMHRGGKMVGGVVYTGFLQASITIHMAGSETNWACRDFLWMVFHYGFEVLGVKKIIGLVASDNPRSMSVTTRLGFIPVAVITEACANGADLNVLTMTREQCKWLKVQPIHYRSRLPTEAIR